MPPDLDERDARYIAKPGHLDTVKEKAEAFVAPNHPRVHVNRLNPATASPAVIRCTDAPPVAADQLGAAAHRLLLALRDVLGFDDDDVVEFAPDPAVQATSTGSHVVHLQQQFHGIPVFQMRRTVVFDRQLRPTQIKGDNVVVPAGLVIMPSVDAVAAVATAAGHVAASENGRRLGVEVPADWHPRVTASLGLPARPAILDARPFAPPTTAHLVVFYGHPRARLAWQVDLVGPEGTGAFTVLVDADDGHVLLQQQRSHAAVRGDVFTVDPDSTARTTVVFPRPEADYRLPVPQGRVFPRDWCSADATEGNNARARFAGEDPRLVRGAVEGGDVVFAPSDEAGEDQLVVNAFYYCNLLHDFFELLGFDENAGNFQVGSRSASGQPGERVEVVAFAQGTFGIASMSPHLDPPTLRLGRHPTTDRHTALDLTVVAHEYTHGVANRLVGGVGDGTGLLQPVSDGIGEGLADFMALSFVNQQRPAGAPMVTGIGRWLKCDNVGLRRRPYDDDYPGRFDDLGKDDYQRPHDVGELFCATLMTFLRSLEATFDQRDDAYLTCGRMVVDALKLVKSNPSFLDMRDAFEEALDDMQANGALTPERGDEVVNLLWAAFAHYGMGEGATCNDAFLDNATVVASTVPRQR